MLFVTWQPDDVFHLSLQVNIELETQQSAYLTKTCSASDIDRIQNGFLTRVKEAVQQSQPVYVRTDYWGGGNQVGQVSKSDSNAFTETT